MKFRTLIVAAGLALASGAAFAHGCPKAMKEIDAALPTAKLTDAQTAEVKKLRAEGQKLHEDKKHKESLEALGKAKAILKI